jgi:FixJ family two-component response regulator
MSFEAEGTSIVLVDHDGAGVGRLLSVHGFQVRKYSSPQALLTELASISPACIIADLSMPQLTGLDLLHLLADSCFEYAIVFITGAGDTSASVLATRDLPVGFLTRPFEDTELIEAVECALERSRVSRENGIKLATFRRRLASLTERERRVFEQVVMGRLNKQIAASLGIAEKTVKVHRARVMQKMQVRSVAQLARVAEKIGTASQQGTLGAR